MFIKLIFALNENKLNGKRRRNGETGVVVDENNKQTNHSYITFCLYVHFDNNNKKESMNCRNAFQNF